MHQVIDWIPVLSSLLSSSPLFSLVRVFHDGAGLNHLPDYKSICAGNEKHADGKTIHIPLVDGDLTNPLTLSVTDEKEEADDVIVRDLEEVAGSKVPDVVKIAEMIEDLEADEVTSYFIVRRKRGGSKAEKKLFSKMNLRRPSEGAFCFCALSPGLLKGGLSLAKRLKHNRVDNLVEIERRSVGGVKSIVTTDDVLLADRCAGLGALVLNAKQLEELIS